MASRNRRSGAIEPAAEAGRTLRALALVAVVIGLVVLTAAACVLSYSSVHAFALRSDISTSLAKVYPYVGDAMLVVAGCSVLALRGAGLISRLYGWLCFIVLLAALAASSVAYEAGIAMTKRAADITAVALPWALVLLAFGLLLALLRHARRRRQRRRAGSQTGAVVMLPQPPELATLEPAEPEPAAIGIAAAQYPTEPVYSTLDRDQGTAQWTVPAQRPGTPADELVTSSGRPESHVQPKHAGKPADLQLRARSRRKPPDLDRPRSSPIPPRD